MSMDITTSENERETEDIMTLSLGMDTLDDFFIQGGVQMGSLVHVSSDPDSLGQYVIANMIAQRPAYYYSLARSEQHVKRNISDIQNVDLSSVQIQEVTHENPIDSLFGAISNTDFPTGTTVIIDPVNMLENQSYDQYKSLLQMFEKKMNEKKGLGILHSINSPAEPQNRWLTEYMCDTILGVNTERVSEAIKNFISIKKAYPDQEIKQDNFRRFELVHDLDIDVTTTRNVSP